MGLHGMGGQGNSWPDRQGCLHSQFLGTAFSAGKGDSWAFSDRMARILRFACNCGVPSKLVMGVF